MVRDARSRSSPCVGCGAAQSATRCRSDLLAPVYPRHLEFSALRLIDFANGRSFRMYRMYRTGTWSRMVAAAAAAADHGRQLPRRPWRLQSRHPTCRCPPRLRRMSLQTRHLRPRVPNCDRARVPVVLATTGTRALAAAPEQPQQPTRVDGCSLSHVTR